MAKRQYGERDHIKLDADGGYYSRRVSAMTAEGLDLKSDIAAELAWRDREIDRLLRQLGYVANSGQSNLLLALADELKDVSDEMKEVTWERVAWVAIELRRIAEGGGE